MLSPPSKTSTKTFFQPAEQIDIDKDVQIPMIISPEGKNHINDPEDHLSSKSRPMKLSEVKTQLKKPLTPLKFMMRMTLEIL